jgi:two-component system, response regulator PdtaR
LGAGSGVEITGRVERTLAPRPHAPRFDHKVNGAEAPEACGSRSPLLSPKRRSAIGQAPHERAPCGAASWVSGPLQAGTVGTPSKSRGCSLLETEWLKWGNSRAGRPFMAEAMEVPAVFSNREAIEPRDERPTDLRPGPPARPAVLLVEDDSLLRITTASYLRDEGFDVIEAADADQAIRVLGYIAVDAVFSDVSRPGSANSLALGRWLRQMRPQVGFLLTSGTEQTAAESQERGLLLSKPYQFSDLSYRLRSILGR